MDYEEKTPNCFKNSVYYIALDIAIWLPKLSKFKLFLTQMT